MARRAIYISTWKQYSVNFLKGYETDVPEADIRKLKKKMTGAAHGSIESAQSINDAFTELIE